MMNQPQPLIVNSDDEDNALSLTDNGPFFVNTTEGLLNPVNPRQDLYLIELVHEIQRKPACLINHIRRIYWCYRKQLTEPLYAALIDFLIVLNQRGHAISRKMVLGARTQLTPGQWKLLEATLCDSDTDRSLLTGNRFSVFSKGLEGTTTLIEKIGDIVSSRQDPLTLAEASIEYSQLDEAMGILENGIREQPDRLPLHQMLLELYQSTNARSRFEQMAAELESADDVLPGGWCQLRDYFEGHSN